MNRKQRRAAAKSGQAAGRLAVQAAALGEDVAAWLRAGVQHHQAGRFADAEVCYRRVLAAQPGNVAALNNRGNALCDLERYEEAVECFSRALVFKPDFAEAFNNRADALFELKRFGEALESCERALALKPNYAKAFNNRGNALHALKRFEEALASYERALALKPDYAKAFNNRGRALIELKRFEEARESCGKALVLKPDFAEAFNNKGNALCELKRFGEALASYENALTLEPGHPYALGGIITCLNSLCDFGRKTGLDKEAAAQISASKSIIAPLSFMASCDDPSLQLLCAKSYSVDRIVTPPRRLCNSEKRHHDKVRIAYLSADFCTHPVAYLIAELIERHDRSRFEVIALDFSEDDGSELRGRIRSAFDRIVDVSTKNDLAAAEVLYGLEADIAIDLMGHTKDSRPGILAHRPAPVQVSYLGYPGTTGTPFIDYIIADKTVAPFEHQPFYTEKIVHLPDCFLVSDSTRTIAAGTPTRQAAGLPEKGFVFCCFNQNWKISPDVYDVWMRLLREVDGSVLWLRADNEAAERNLRREAHERGVDPARLVFAARLPSSEDHLARHRLADLFLDTPRYNAHTTANDALWAGVPVVTQLGEAFAGRVAASLIYAIGLPELVTQTLEDYESLALRLAREPALLASFRTRLNANRVTHPLFDTDHFRRQIEAAYLQMHEISQRGEPPRSFEIEAGEVSPIQLEEAPAEAIAKRAPKAEQTPTGGDASKADPSFAQIQGPGTIDSLTVRIGDGCQIAVPASLSAITAYVLLEQEEWFEKEIGFLRKWLRPGMTVIDIGANLGVYSLPMARLVAPSGPVFAYEPASGTRRLLSWSAQLNGFDNLTVLAEAISDKRGDGFLRHGSSSELNSLGESGPGERITITCLDAEETKWQSRTPDFIKIDAEGEEQRILSGGRSFFARHSPLVMFEIKAGVTVNERLRELFPAMGYRLYRLLAGAPVLVPDRGEQLDGYELNLFAAKPDRAALLAREGLLVETVADWRPPEAVRDALAGSLRSLPFAPAFDSLFNGTSPQDIRYRDCLAAFAAWQSPEIGVAERYAALEFARSRLVALCQGRVSWSRLVTLARIAWEDGQRTIAVHALGTFIAAAKRQDMTLTEPFWPACPRYDTLPPGSRQREWLLASAVEQFERISSFSSIFGGCTEDLAWLCQTPFAGTEMERRRTLAEIRAGRSVKMPKRLASPAPDHLNFQLWRDKLGGIASYLLT
jgi:FkbM family methyltransferase